MSIDTALAEIERCAGSQFDPEIAACFIRMVKSENEQKQS